MSLMCANCGRTIVLSEHPLHYGVCSVCGNTMTDEERDRAKIFILEHTPREYNN